MSTADGEYVRFPRPGSSSLRGRPGVAVGFQALEDAIRREIVEGILSQRKPCPNGHLQHWPSKTCRECGRNDMVTTAANIVLGLHREPTPAAGEPAPDPAPAPEPGPGPESESESESESIIPPTVYATEDHQRRAELAQDVREAVAQMHGYGPRRQVPGWTLPKFAPGVFARGGIVVTNGAGAPQEQPAADVDTLADDGQEQPEDTPAEAATPKTAIKTEIRGSAALTEDVIRRAMDQIRANPSLGSRPMSDWIPPKEPAPDGRADEASGPSSWVLSAADVDAFAAGGQEQPEAAPPAGPTSPLDGWPMLGIDLGAHPGNSCFIVVSIGADGKARWRLSSVPPSLTQGMSPVKTIVDEAVNLTVPRPW